MKEKKSKREMFYKVQKFDTVGVSGRDTHKINFKLFANDNELKTCQSELVELGAIVLSTAFDKPVCRQRQAQADIEII